ncbi:MAG TPA: CCA tRNA nucleotidyltransferase [Actinomycetota bacterium]|nr:CCA tRNA nucleotidyltransferase [Actinomycetota bacterium]
MASIAELFEPRSPVMKLASSFASRGHELYLVGGPVRDSLIKRPVEDVDLSTDATPDVILEIVSPVASAVWEQGKEFGTIGAAIEGTRFEITTFRTERYQPASRHPEVSFSDDVVTDLSRRDFTINAMAIRLPGKEAIDPFGGVEDLRARVLRTPVDPKISFSDDPLRMLRAFRFASQLDFGIHADTLAAITAMASELATVSNERIRDELSKLIMGLAPARALELATDCGLTQLFLPELPALKLEQDPIQRHKDVFHHTLAVVERTEPDLIVRLAALLHDIGKPKTRRIDETGVTFHHHEVVGADMAAARLRELRFPNDVVHGVSEIIRLHHRFHTYRLGWTDSAVRRYVRDAGSLLEPLNRLVRADCTTRNRAKAARLAERMDDLDARIAELAEQEELDRIRPDLDGAQVMAFLGIPPGPIVGRAAAFLLEERLERGPLDPDDAYASLAAWASENGIEVAGTKVPPKPRGRLDDPGGKK